MTIRHFAVHAYKLLVADLSGRRNLRSAWESLEPEFIATDIRPAWVSTIEREIRRAVQAERDRCLGVVIEARMAIGPNTWDDLQTAVSHPNPDPMEGL